MRISKYVIFCLCGLGMAFGSITEVAALTLNASGQVTDWGIDPFGPGNVYDRNANHLAWKPYAAPYATRWKEENNYSPISYPLGGYTPSPGLPEGEIYDLEAVYCRINRGLADDSLQVLIVTSMPTHVWTTTHNYHYRIGDLFMDMGGDGIIDYAVTTTDWDDCQPWQAYDVVEQKYLDFNHNGTPGSLYGISSDTSTVIDPDCSTCQVVTGVGHNLASGWYGGNADLAYAEEVFRPWVVDEDKASPLGTVGLQTAAFNYGGKIGGGYFIMDPNYWDEGILEDEDATWFYEYTIPLSMLSPTLDEADLMFLGLHMTTECGNDVIKTTSGGADGGGLEPPIPEPLTMLGVMLGLGSVGAYIRRRRMS